ncbi:MAG: Bifunctional primase/polymerase [Bacteroidota bacterium]|nr:Bifunctional primase/polymerase [Bacteroidota bacterium]
MIENLIKKGYSLIPLNYDKSPKLRTWTNSQKEAIKDLSIFKDNNIGLVCGKVSGNILVIDVDCKYDLTGKLYSDLKELIENSKEGLFDKFQIHATVKGGFHLIFKTESDPIGNKKLASRLATEEEKAKGDKVKVLIETRGEGGYICFPPMDGYSILKEGFETITDDELDILLSCCRSFNEIQEKEVEYNKKIDNSIYVNSPFEDYNNRGDCVQELINNGWKFVFERGSNIHLKRPGSTDSRTSANFSKEHNKFYVFSTSTEFKENTAYSPVAVYCKLNHNDNWSECAKDLINKGYGKKREVIGKKYATAIQRMKKEDASKDDIVIELRKIEGKPIDELNEIIDNYEANLGKKISTFWKVDINQKGDSKITISYYDFCRFVNDSLNIFRFKLKDDDIGFRYVKLKDGKIFNVSMAEIKDSTKDYLESLEPYFDGIYKDQLMEVLYRSANSIFSDNMLEFLEYTNVEILRATDSDAYFPFLNCIVRVSKYNKIEVLNYDEINGKYVWDSSVIKHNFELDFDYKNFSFYKFLEKITNDDINRLDFCKQIVGYLLHEYKDPLNPISVIFGEETSDTNLGGGAGKGILTNAISKLTNLVTIDGKSFNPDREFAFQRVNVDSRLVVLQDTTDKFDFESLFSKTTDGFTIRKMFTPEIFVPFEMSPKFIITTNYTIDNESGASERRLKLLEFSSFFNSKNKPIDFLGEVLFNSWNNEKWNKFYTLMFDCLLVYLENGITEISETQTSKIKRISTKYGDDFLGWFKEYQPDEDYTDFQDIYLEFLKSVGYNERGYSQKRFSYAVSFACETYNFHLDKIKDPVTKRLKQKWFNNLVEPKTEELDNDLAF